MSEIPDEAGLASFEGVTPSEDTVALLLLPDPEQLLDVGGWVRDHVAVLVEMNAVLPDECSTSALCAVLAQLVESPRPDGFTWRYVLFSALQVAPLCVEVGFAPVTSVEDQAWDQLIGAGADSAAGKHVADFELNGVKGRHCLSFSLRDPETLLEEETGELWVTAGIVSRRRIGDQLVDVVAGVTTPQVEVLLGSLLTLYDLVSGDGIVKDYEASMSVERPRM